MNECTQEIVKQNPKLCIREVLKVRHSTRRIIVKAWKNVRLHHVHYEYIEMLEIMGCNQSSQPVTISNFPGYNDKWITNPTTANSNGFILVKPLPNMTKGSMQNGHVADPKVVDALLEEYRECEDRIRSYEREDPLILYYVKQSRLKSIDEMVKKHSETIATLEKRVMEDIEANAGANEDGNGTGKALRSLRSALKEANDSEKLSKAEQDMIAKKNQLEIAETELEMLFQEKALLESDIQELKSICENLTRDYKRQEDIAAKLTVNNAPGGTELELLNELANIETRRIKISEVHERWKEARVQVADSCRQFSSALQKWRNIKGDSVDNQYDIAEEARDELITALQFLANAKFFVQHELPYCTKQEIAILNKALTYIFVDMRSEERRKHADSCYAAFHNRAVALYAWIDTTLKAIIQPVVMQTSEDLKSTMSELQDMRFQSIKHQFPNVTWHNPDKKPIITNRSGSISSGESLSDSMSIELLQQLDLSQLAPLPRTVDLFGKQNEDLVENYKMTLKESMAKEKDIQDNIEELAQKRKESLTEKNLVEADTVGLA